MKTVFYAVQKLNSLDTMIEMLECMDEAGTMRIEKRSLIFLESTAYSFMK